MLAVGDIHIYVTNLEPALRFWADGLQLEVAERDGDDRSAFARLDFPDGGPSLILVVTGETAELDARPAGDLNQMVTFDLVTSDFDATVVRLLEHGGQQIGEIETYHTLKLVTISDPEGNAFDLIEIPADAE